MTASAREFDCVVAALGATSLLFADPLADDLFSARSNTSGRWGLVSIAPRAPEAIQPSDSLTMAIA